MTYRGFARTNTGATVYAHERPAEDVVDWVASAIAGTEDSTVPGQYWFDGLDETKSYECYVQSGGTPDRGDLPFWEFPEVLGAADETPVNPWALTVLCQDGHAGPVAGCVVSILGTTHQDVTDSFGQVRFVLGAGTYDVRVTPPSGFSAPDDQQITLSSDDSLTFVLAGTPATSGPGWIG